MSRIFVALVLTVGLALTACTRPTPYQPAVDRYGYTEQQLESDRFRVTFTGNSATPRDTVENYLIFRAAELTLAQGADHFLVTERMVEGLTDYRYSGGPYFYPSIGFGSHGGWFGGVATGLGTGYARTRYVSSATILLGKGDTPPDPSAYDAREIVQRLGPLIHRPEV